MLTRRAQIDNLVKLLDSDEVEEMTLEQLATRIVDAYHSALEADIKSAPGAVHEGMAIKTPWSSKVYHVAWLSPNGEHVWMIESTSSYGWLGSVDSPMWKRFEISRAKAGAPGNNPLLKVGMTVRRKRLTKSYRVLATGDKCVLLQSTTDAEAVFAEPNGLLMDHYDWIGKPKDD